MTVPAVGAAAMPRDAAKGRPVRTAAAQGRVFLWPGCSLWIGRAQGRSEWHDHHAHQLALAPDDEFRFRTEKDGAWTVYRGAIVPSHCPHAFEADDANMVQLFVEPESTEGRALMQRFDTQGVSELPEAAARQAARTLFDALQGHADTDAMQAVARTAIGLLAGLPPDASGIRTVDPRLARALEHIRSRVREPLSLSEAASVATLSPSRFRHLFVQETGTSFRAYLLWLRLNLAVEAAMAGASWTEAAHVAGFADSAHLTRTHTRMFGMVPTALRRE